MYYQIPTSQQAQTAQVLPNHLITPVQSQFTHANSALGMVSGPGQVPPQFTPSAGTTGQVNPSLVTAVQAGVPNSFIAPSAAQPQFAVGTGTVNPGLLTAVTAGVPNSFIASSVAQPQVAVGTGSVNPALVTAATSFFGVRASTQPQFTHPQCVAVGTVNPPLPFQTGSAPRGTQLTPEHVPQVGTVNPSLVTATAPTQPLYNSQFGNQTSGPSETAPHTEDISQHVKKGPTTPERPTHIITLVSSPTVSPHINRVHTPVKETSTVVESKASTSNPQLNILKSPIVVQKSEAISQIESRISSLETNLDKLVTLLTNPKESMKTDEQLLEEKPNTPPKKIESVQNASDDGGRPSSPEMFSDGADTAFGDVQPEIDKILRSKAMQQDSSDNNDAETSFPSLLGSVKSFGTFEESIRSSSSVKAGTGKRKRPGRPKKRS